MKSKLIFLDIDGTLTPPGSNTPPASAIDAVNKARANGHKVLLCSGRNLPLLNPLLDKYQFEGAVGGTGAIVLIHGKIIYDYPMEQTDFLTAMKLLGENHVFRSVESKYGSWCDEGMGEFLAGQSGGNSELLRWRKALEDELGFRPMKEYPGCPVYKIVFMCEKEEQIAPARQALGTKYNFLLQDTKESSVCLNGEIISCKYNKGTGVRLAAQALEYELADTIGFGDSMNDMDMIKTVGFSVCMENGSPSLKSVSNYICPSVHNDGIYHAFQSLGLID